MRDGYLSVFALYIRLTYKKIAAVLITMAAVEAVLLNIIGMNEETFSNASVRSFFPFVTIAAVSIIAYIIIYCCGRGSRAVYTLARLKISLNRVFFVVLFYFTLVYLVFWFFQAVTLFALSRYFAANVQAAAETPHIFVSFVLSGYLATFIPISGLISYIAGFMKVLFLSTTAAISHFDLIIGRRKSGNGIAAPFIVAVFSGKGVIENPMLYSVYVIALLALAVVLNLIIRGRFNSIELFSVAESNINPALNETGERGIL